MSSAMGGEPDEGSPPQKKSRHEQSPPMDVSLCAGSETALVRRDSSIVCAATFIAAERLTLGKDPAHPTGALVPMTCHLLWPEVDVDVVFGPPPWPVPPPYCLGNPEVGCVRLTKDAGTTSVPAARGFGMMSNDLVKVDTSPLRGVTRIGFFVFHAANKLRAIDLRGFTSVTWIGRYFLHTAFIEGLDTSPLLRMTSVPSDFVCHCYCLRSISLAGFVNVVEVGPHFLNHCECLEALDLTPFAKVKKLGSHFLAGCTALQSLDLSPMTAGEHVDDYMLAGNQLAQVIRPQTGQLADIAIPGLRGGSGTQLRLADE